MNQRQQLFANTYLRHNDPTIAYMEAYKPRVPNYRAIMSAANRLLRKPEIAEYISSVRDSVRSQLEYELKEQMKEELLTIHEKRLYIKRVINGEILIPQDYKTTGCNRCTMFLRPTFPQILGYLKEDSRLAGHYPEKRRAATRQQLTTNNTSPSGAGGNFTPDICQEEESQQPNAVSSLSPLEETSKRQQKTTNNTSPLAGVQTAIGKRVKPIPTTPPRIASHAGLRKLIEKQRQRSIRETASL